MIVDIPLERWYDEEESEAHTTERSGRNYEDS